MKEDLGTYIRSLRTFRKMTLEELGRAAGGLSHSYLSQIENGKRTNVSNETIQKLADALGIESYDLLEMAGYIKRGNSTTKKIMDTVTKEKLNKLLFYFSEVDQLPVEKKIMIKDFENAYKPYFGNDFKIDIDFLKQHIKIKSYTFFKEKLIADLYEIVKDTNDPVKLPRNSRVYINEKFSSQMKSSPIATVAQVINLILDRIHLSNEESKKRLYNFKQRINDFMKQEGISLFELEDMLFDKNTNEPLFTSKQEAEILHHLLMTVSNIASLEQKVQDYNNELEDLIESEQNLHDLSSYIALDKIHYEGTPLTESDKQLIKAYLGALFSSRLNEKANN